jgi:hypothetical protein
MREERKVKVRKIDCERSGEFSPRTNQGTPCRRMSHENREMEQHKVSQCTPEKRRDLADCQSPLKPEEDSTRDSHRGAMT